MSGIDIVVVGASAGGVEALKALVSSLPGGFQPAVFIVAHTSRAGPGLLPEILDRAGPLPAAFAEDGARFAGGHIHVAPPDRHMLIEAPDRIRVTRGPKENGFRPAIDPLFRSAALSFSPRIAGIILSGNLDDGTVGLAAIKRRGGIAIVQDPAEASAPSMPLSALRHVRVDHCVGLANMAPLLTRLSGTPDRPNERPIETEPMAEELEFEVNAAANSSEGDASAVLKLGHPSLLTCPDCHGTLVQLREEGPLRFRCHTGHAFTAASLVASLSESTEQALWSTFRGLQEKIMLLRHMAAHSRESEKPGEVARLLRQAHSIQQRAQLVRQALLADDALTDQSSTRRAGGADGS